MLILKRLIYLIEEIEQGLRPNFLVRQLKSTFSHAHTN